MVTGSYLYEEPESRFTIGDSLCTQQLVNAACLEQSDANIDEINFSEGGNLDKFMIQRLSSGEYIMNMHNIIIAGPKEAGKTYLACAFGAAACKQNNTVKYVHFPDLLLEIKIAKETGLYEELISHYLKFKLLIVDDWLQSGLSEEQTNDLIALILARFKHSSTIFCTRLSPQTWYEKIGDLSLEDAIINRIIRNSYIVELQGMELIH